MREKINQYVKRRTAAKAEFRKNAENAEGA
jgi:hypothetical protein